MKSHLVAMLMVAGLSPSWAAEPTASPNDARPESTGQASPQDKDERDKADAAAILAARQKAVDDIRAGRPAPYYFAFPQAAPAPSAPPAPRPAD
jgi:hypothetical protein